MTWLHFIYTEFFEVCFNNAVGVANPSIISDNQMNASSTANSTQFDDHFQAAYGRLNSDRGDGWCTLEPSRTDDWLQVDFNRTMQVCGVATQGDNGLGERQWVTDFKLSFSSDGNTWTTYTEADNTEIVRCKLYYTV